MNLVLQNGTIAETGLFPPDQINLSFFLSPGNPFIPARNQKWLCLNRLFVIKCIVVVIEG